MIETKIYWVLSGCPSDDIIKDCLKLAIKNNIRIWLHWFGPDNQYYGGYHQIFINYFDTFEIVKDKLPKTYGL